MVSVLLGARACARGYGFLLVGIFLGQRMPQIGTPCLESLVSSSGISPGQRLFKRLLWTRVKRDIRIEGDGWTAVLKKVIERGSRNLFGFMGIANIFRVRVVIQSWYRNRRC